MNSLLYSLRFFLVFLLVVLFGNAVVAQLQLTQSVNNLTTGGDGLSAYTGDMLQYSIAAKNTSAANVINARLYGIIPAGTSYVTGSTTVNGVAVADVNGKMPFINSGGLINSPAYTSGVLAPNITATVVFRVRVNANVGTTAAYVTLRAGDSTGIIAATSNTINTVMVVNSICNAVYQTTGVSKTSSTFNQLKTVSTTNGTSGPIIYDGSTGPCYDATTNTLLPSGSILSSAAAIAYDKNLNRVYFVNNTNTQAPLCYIDLSSATISAWKYTGYPLETNTASGYNINRMTIGSDGYGYALTSNCRDLIRFYIDPSTNLPVISRLGSLINSVTNGSYDILAEVGGDIFADGSGKLYMTTNSSRMYSIDPATRIATYSGSLSPNPGTSNSFAVSGDGYAYLGGSYQYVYRVNLASLSAAAINSSTTNVFYSGDYASCSLPVLAPLLKATKSYRNVNAAGNLSGDTVECTIEVTDTGNINAAAVMLFDTIPFNGTYFPGSTTLNGVSVADVDGAMPYAAAGGQYINSSAETSGVVKVGDANKVIIKYLVFVPALQTICNQALVTYPAASGDMVQVFSDDPAQPGSLDATCFYADTTSNAPGGRMVTSNNNTTQWNGLPSIQVRPNPFHSELHVQVQLTTAQMVTVRIFDLYGRSIYTTAEKLQAGATSLNLHLPSHLSNGAYMLQVLTGNNTLLQQKILKQ